MVVLDNPARFKKKLEEINYKPLNEICTFTCKNKNLYVRLHKYRGERKISEVMRELIELGLQSKGL